MTPRWWICEKRFIFPLVLQWQFVLSNSASSEMFFVLCRSLCFFLLFFEHRNMQINRCYSLFFSRVVWGFEWGFLWSEKNPGVTVEEQKRERQRERADIKDRTQAALRVFTNREWIEQIIGRHLQYGLSWEGLSKKNFCVTAHIKSHIIPEQTFCQKSNPYTQGRWKPISVINGSRRWYGNMETGLHVACKHE